MKNEHTVQLKWRAATSSVPIASYNIYQDNEKVAEVNGNIHEYEITNLQGNKSYFFSIIAVDEAGIESKVNPSTTVKLGEAPVVFSDIENHWAKESINQAVLLGILKGFPDGTYKPAQVLTRSQATSIIVRSLNLDVQLSETPFGDIDKLDSATKAEITTAHRYGIIQGSSTSSFNPSEPVTRAQLALMLNRVYTFVNGGPYEIKIIAPFTDIKNDDLDTQKAISMLTELGVVQGYRGQFMPSNGTTRAEAAVMIVNYLAIQ